jgi:thiol-disulfide isomerase/thioredoxin
VFNRTNLLIVAIALLGAAAGFVVGGWVKSPGLPPERGMTALEAGAVRPPLALPDLDARPRDLAEWDGKLVLLNFWASWCGPCREEMPLLDRIQQRHADRGLQVIGVAIDDRASVQGFLAEHPVAYPILVDEPGVGPDSSQRFGDNRGALPYSVLIGPDRRVLERRFGSFTEAGLEEWIAPHLGD